MTTLSAVSDAETLPSPSSDLLSSVPSLTTTTLLSNEDKTAALKLIADSIAQQRQVAAKAVIFHHVSLAAYVLFIAIVSRLLYHTSADLPLIGTTVAGITMAFLVGVRSLTAGYLALAEQLDWSFLRNEETGDDDIVIGSRFGEEIIGATVLRLERNGNIGSNGNGKRKSKHGKTGGKGLVRAWTTRLRYRGKGVGTELLEEVVKIVWEKLGREAEIGFEVRHANSGKVLPAIFTSGLRKGEMKAAQKLERVRDEMDIGRGKRRKSNTK